MDNIKLTVGLEPTDKYLKAKQDLLQAIKSIGELCPQQRRHLAEELFGIQKVLIFEKVFSHYMK